MNYHQYYPVDIVNGPGTRCTLFVSGCVHECPGCYNKSTWRVNSGQPFTKAMEDKIIKDLNDTRIKRQGISLSGGDPLHPQNVPDILKLVKRIRAECPGKDIWVWTGYKLDELNATQMQVVDLINVLVDGKFVQDLKDPFPDLARQQQSGGASFAMISSLLPECRQQGNEELTILLVIGVAGRFQLLCSSLRFFYFTFICQLQRVVNLTDQNVETVAEIFHFRAVR